MTTTWKAVIGIVALLLLAAAIFAYKLHKSIAGSEPLPGTQSTIPVNTGPIPALTKGKADFPNWRNIGFDGRTSISGVKTNWAGGLKKLWSVDYLCQGRSTASWAAPVVQGNRLVVPGRDEKNDLVICLDAETGRLIWKGEYAAPAGDAHGPGARATPFIDGDKVYTYGRSGDIACWQLLDGKLLWHRNVKEIGGAEPGWGLSSTPLVIENKVIVQGGGKALVAAYDKTNGELMWKSLEGASGYAAIVPIAIGSLKYLLVYHAVGLSCLDPGDGKETWRVPWPTEYGVNATTPTVEKDLVFITSGYGQGCQLLKAAKEGFTILWTNRAIASHHSDPFIIDGYIYGYSGQSQQNNGDFKCLELLTGKEMWSTKEIGWGTAVAVNDNIICMDIKGSLFLIKPESSGFKKVAEMKAAIPGVKNPAWTLPVAANGKLYLRYLQHLICYDLMP